MVARGVVLKITFDEWSHCGGKCVSNAELALCTLLCSPYNTIGSPNTTLDLLLSRSFCNRLDNSCRAIHARAVPRPSCSLTFLLNLLDKALGGLSNTLAIRLQSSPDDAFLPFSSLLDTATQFCDPLASSAGHHRLWHWVMRRYGSGRHSFVLWLAWTAGSVVITFAAVALIAYGLALLKTHKSLLSLKCLPPFLAPAARAACNHNVPDASQAESACEEAPQEGKPIYIQGDLLSSSSPTRCSPRADEATDSHSVSAHSHRSVADRTAAVAARTGALTGNIDDRASERECVAIERGAEDVCRL
ncbi:unnamed protein product [Vitrella brassicaformis CCMP3155]|uniref:Uncharacterized protein n=1 Tax=Vitrella brassicaformis (strain CCMP3155) TaxID=1169540 RepID=A0A0G4EDC6_VITBC|nr:unnamed protein product [Vitrella brassicaformis CCMP3155]|eukprot:CEL93700.1 unnamed protein product [Vitrella brassicaformis CCMP3155]